MFAIFKKKELNPEISLFREEIGFAKELYFEGKNEILLNFLENSVKKIENSEAFRGSAEKSLIKNSLESIKQKKSRESLDFTLELVNLLDRRSKLSIVTLVLFVLVVSVNFVSPIKIYNDLLPDRKIQKFISENPNHAIKDLLDIKIALEKYRLKNRVYPKSTRIDGFLSCYGKSSADWIPGLAPVFIDKLPLDKRNSKNCDFHYYYMSDGIDYKIISHKPDDCIKIKEQFPNLIDPTRQCWGYGFWTDYGSKF